jgi:hypothetical protein
MAKTKANDKIQQAVVTFETRHAGNSNYLNEALVSPLKPSGYYMYHQFNIQQFYVPPTQCIYVFCVDLRTNSDYFPIQH